MFVSCALVRLKAGALRRAALPPACVRYGKGRKPTGRRRHAYSGPQNWADAMRGGSRMAATGRHCAELAGPQSERMARAVSAYHKSQCASRKWTQPRCFRNASAKPARPCRCDEPLSYIHTIAASTLLARSGLLCAAAEQLARQSTLGPCHGQGVIWRSTVEAAAVVRLTCMCQNWPICEVVGILPRSPFTKGGLAPRTLPANGPIVVCALARTQGARTRPHDACALQAAGGIACTSVGTARPATSNCVV